jgi:flagellar biosynthesis chaperone FliJ
MIKKDLHTLIRLRKWDVDEKQRALAVVLRAEEAIVARQEALEAEIKNELALAGQLPADQRGTLYGYLKRCEGHRAALASALDDVRQRIIKAQDHLAEAYRHLKTFEVTQEKRDLAEEHEESRLEIIDLDEIGLNLHRRKSA